ADKQSSLEPDPSRRRSRSGGQNKHAPAGAFSGSNRSPGSMGLLAQTACEERPPSRRQGGRSACPLCSNQKTRWPILAPPEIPRTKTFNSGNGHYTALTDERASQTTWTRNSRGLAIQSSYAANSGAPISVQTSWHADFPKPTSITRPRSSSSFSYDTNGNLLSVTHTDTWAGSPARTTDFTYQAGGLVTSIDGPLPGAADTTSLTYTSEGYLASVSDPKWACDHNNV
ncbi:MAG: hypothetical protein AAF829_13430, partial [Pseudomonadota bacterium]